MVIKVKPAERKQLLGVDPSGDTFAWVRRATGAACLERGELVGDVVYLADGSIRVIHNPVALQNLEIWLTAGNDDGEIGNIVVEYGDGETRTFFAKPYGEYTRAEFVEELTELDPLVVAEWHSKVREVTALWRY